MNDEAFYQMIDSIHHSIADLRKWEMELFEEQER